MKEVVRQKNKLKFLIIVAIAILVIVALAISWVETYWYYVDKIVFTEDSRMMDEVDRIEKHDSYIKKLTR